MSFVQTKLIQASVQSSGVFDLYVYEPDNSDALADVTAADYFSKSRFIGTDGWVDGIINAKLADGFFLLQVQSDGTTVVQVGAGGGDIPAIEAAIDLLDDNVRGFSIIDMNNADYTMTDSEAQASVKVIINTGDGTKILTVPTTADTLTPGDFSVITLFAGNSFFLVAQTTGSPLEILSPSVDMVSFSSMGGVAPFYALNVSDAAYDATWSGSQLIPTQDTVYGKINAQHTLVGTQILTSGDYTPTAGTRFVEVYLQGGGGGGGGADTAAVSSAAGGGGAAGGENFFTAVVSDAVTYDFEVGAAGGGGAAAGGDGTNGSATSLVIGATTYTAEGGLGGKGSAASAVLAVAAGGATTNISGSGDKKSGEAGGAGITMTDVLGLSGKGGNSSFGAGGAQRITQGTGNSATNLGNGGGGGGGLCLNGGAAAAGGSGAQGCAVIFEYT